MADGTSSLSDRYFDLLRSITSDPDERQAIEQQAAKRARSTTRTRKPRPTKVHPRP